MDLFIVESIQKVSNNYLDSIFKFISKFGEAIPFIVIFYLLYWCVSNKSAIRFLFVYGTGILLNSLIKPIFKRQRPFVESNNIIDKYNSNGYSFPSGHTVSATLAFGGNYVEVKNKTSKPVNILFSILNCLIITLVMFSRLYLGQHYLSDVICGFLFAILWLIIAPKVYNLFKNADYKILLIICPLAVIISLFSSSPFVVNEQCTKIYLVCGLLFGVLIGYFIDRHFIKHKQKSILFLVVKGAVCSVFTLLFLLTAISVCKFLISYFLSFTVLGLITTIGYSAIFEFFNNLLLKRKNKYENL